MPKPTIPQVLIWCKNDLQYVVDLLAQSPVVKKGKEINEALKILAHKLIFNRRVVIQYPRYWFYNTAKK